MKEIFSLLQRHDQAELADNRMTVFAPGFGLGSVHYWDGSWDNDEDQLPHQMQEVFQNRDGALRLTNAAGEDETLVVEHRLWQPHAIATRSIGRKSAVWWEQKSIHRDTAVDWITFQGGGLRPQRLWLEHVIPHSEALEIERLPRGVHLLARSGRNQGIHRFIGFGGKGEVRFEHDRRGLRIRVEVCLLPEQPQSMPFVVAAGEHPEETGRRWRDALRHGSEWSRHASERWEKFFSDHVPKFSCDDQRWEKLYYMAFYALRANLYDFKKGAIRHPYSCPSKWRLCPSWFWDPCFHGFSEKWLRAYPAPISTFRNHFAAQDELGYLPMTLDSRGNTWKAMGAAERQCQQFLHPITIWDWYLVHGKRSVLAEALPHLAAHSDYIWNHRQPDPDMPLFVAENGAEVADNSSRLVSDPAARAELHSLRRKIQPFDWNVYQAVSERLIARMARETGNATLFEKFTQRSSQREAALRRLWNPAIGLFTDRLVPSGQLSTKSFPESLLALFGGVASPSQARSEVRFLTDPKRLWTRFPVPTLPIDDPDFNAEDNYGSYWNGRVWPNMNWLYIEGLARNKSTKAGTALLERTLEMMGGDGFPRILENYHPLKDETYSIPHCIFHYGWGAVCADLIIRRGCGFQPNAADKTMSFDPWGLPGATEARFEGLPFGNTGVALTCRKQGNSWKTEVRSRSRLKRLKTPVHWLDI